LLLEQRLAAGRGGAGSVVDSIDGGAVQITNGFVDETTQSKTGKLRSVRTFVSKYITSHKLLPSTTPFIPLKVVLSDGGSKSSCRRARLLLLLGKIGPLGIGRSSRSNAIFAEACSA